MAERRRAAGAEIVDGGVHFRVWAPERKQVHVVTGDREYALERENDGHFAALIDLDAGALYRFRLDDERESYPDPASRFQPEGPQGASMVIDPSAYAWRDHDWRGVSASGLVIYELHIGTFTREGTWRAAEARLRDLADIGINLIEVMPVSEFPGRFGWGYDGVDLWAPSHLYGTPDDFRHFVDTAHALGAGVILDVVYNHLGPDGCYLSKFSPHYFTKKYANEWGEAINFDGEGSCGVRELFAENAAYWIDEFHLDGLRADATQSICDESSEHILSLIANRARRAAAGRTIFLVAENEPQNVDLIDRYGFDAMWNDDWHHSAHLAATGHVEAYYTDYRGKPQEFVSMAQYGFLYQGQWYSWQKQRRGTPSRHLLPRSLVCYLEDHDQVANSARGVRLTQLTSPGRYRALTALLLLQPQTPMLFQGQERGARQPFLYFADHHAELARAVGKGRREFLSQFRSIETDRLASPEDPATFLACKLDEAGDPAIEALVRDLLALRRGDETFASQRNDILHGAVLGDDAFLLRFIPEETAGERLLLINLGRDLRLDPAPEPLLAPPRGWRWASLWSSEALEYGGGGRGAVDEKEWQIPGEAAVVLRVSQFIPSVSEGSGRF
jgi:maltooligosyltrehalose trehalohydrolase